MADLVSAPSPGSTRDPFYNTPEWREFAATIVARDGYRCTVARLLGGECSGPLHVNHIRARRRFPHLALDPDNCGTACASHHPQWERLVRAILEHQERRIPRCPHRHVTREGREACERRMARERGLVAA